MSTEKYIGEAALKDKPGKKINLMIRDGAITTSKLADGSVTNDKLAENSITKDKLQDKTIGVEKLDNELRQTISAASGLPENLVETIQNVDDTLKDHQSQLDDKQSQIDDKQQQIIANDEDISLLQTRSTQMEESIKAIAATGGASQATAVTYDNEKSKLTAINIQSAIDELQSSKFDKASITQKLGGAEDKVMSQKAVNAKFSDLTAQITETTLFRTIERPTSDEEKNENFGVLINRGETYMFKNVGEGTITLSIYGASTNEILKTFTLSPSQFVYYTQDSVDKTVGIKLVWKEKMIVDVNTTSSKFDKLDKLEAPLRGKKIFTYGDSLVNNGGWQDYISSLGANVINSGIGGSTLSYRDRKQYVNKDGKYVGDPNEGYTPKEGETLINDTGSGEQRMQYIAKDADYIIVLFGTNDCHQNKTIGTFDDEDNTTFKGAIKTLIKWIRTNRPLAKIVFLTPTIERTDFTNNLSLHKIDYVKAILDAEIELNVPVVNLWSRTSWSKENYQNYSSDDIHWNDLGKKEIGKIIAGYLLSEL